MLDCEPELDPRLRKRGKGRGRGGSSAGSALDPSATTGVPLGPLESPKPYMYSLNGQPGASGILPNPSGKKPRPRKRVSR